MRTLALYVLLLPVVSTSIVVAAQDVDIVFTKRSSTTEYVDRLGELYIDGSFFACIRERVMRPANQPLLSDGRWKLRLSKTADSMMGTFFEKSGSAPVGVFLATTAGGTGDSNSAFQLSRNPEGADSSDSALISELFAVQAVATEKDLEVTVSSWIDGAVVKLSAFPVFKPDTKPTELGLRTSLLEERVTPGLYLDDAVNFLWAKKGSGTVGFQLPPGVAALKFEYVVKAYPKVSPADPQNPLARKESDAETVMGHRLNNLEGEEANARTVLNKSGDAVSVHRWYVKNGFSEGLNKLSDRPESDWISVKRINISYFVPYPMTIWRSASGIQTLRCTSPSADVRFFNADTSFAAAAVTNRDFLIAWQAAGFTDNEADKFFLEVQTTNKPIPSPTLTSAIQRSDTSPGIAPTAEELKTANGGTEFTPVSGNVVHVGLTNKRLEVWTFSTEGTWTLTFTVEPSNLLRLCQRATAASQGAEEKTLSFYLSGVADEVAYRVSPFENIFDGTGGFVVLDLPDYIETARVVFRKGDGSK